MADVELTFFADAKDAEKEIIRLGKQVEKLQSKNKAATRAGKQSSAEMRFGMQKLDLSAGNVLKTLGGLAAPLLAAVSAQKLLTAEFDKFQNRQRFAGDNQVQLAPFMAQAVQNLGEAEFDELELEKRIQAIANRQRKAAPAVANAASTALSSRGNLSAEAALKSVEAGFRFSKFDDAAASELSGGALTLQSRFGEGVTAEEAIGFLAATGTKGQIVQAADLANNAAPAIAGVSQFGGSAREAAALFDTLSLGMVDKSGEQSSTTAIQFARALRDRLNPETGFPEATTLEKRLRLLQSDPALSRRFLEGGKFGDQQFGQPALGKGAAIPTVEALVGFEGADPQKAQLVRANFDQILKDLPTLGAESQVVFDKKIQQMAQMQSAQVAEVSQAFASVSNEVLAQNPRTAMAGVVREGLKKSLSSIPSTALSDKVLLADFERRQLTTEEDPITSGRKLVETARNRLRNPRRSGFSPAGGFGTSTPRTPTPDERQAAEALTLLLQELIELQKRNNEIQLRRENQLKQAAKPRINRNANDEAQ